MGQTIAHQSENKSSAKYGGALRASAPQGSRMTNQTSSNEFPATAIMMEEALRSFVPSELWQAYEKAAKRRRELPRRSVRYSVYFHGEQASSANRTAAQIRTAEAAMKQAWQQVMAELRSQLLAGTLTAYVREAFPFGPVRPIPPDAWRSLRITSLRSGRAKGPGGELTGIRIASGSPGRFGPVEDTPPPDSSLSADTPAHGASRAPPFSHNHDFTVVRLGDDEFHFGFIQAAVVEELHKASLTADPWRSGKVLLYQAHSQSRSLSDIFRRHTDPSWRLLIEYHHNGNYRLRSTPLP